MQPLCPHTSSKQWCLKIINAAFFPACALPLCLLKSFLAENLWAACPGEPSWHPHLSRCFFPLLARWKQQQQATDEKWTTKWMDIQTEWLSVFNETNRTNSAEISRKPFIGNDYQHASWWKMWCMDKENLTECNTCKRKIKVNEHRRINWTSHVHNWELKRSLNLQAYIVLMGWINSFL